MLHEINEHVPKGVANGVKYDFLQVQLFERSNTKCCTEVLIVNVRCPKGWHMETVCQQIQETTFSIMLLVNTETKATKAHPIEHNKC